MSSPRQTQFDIGGMFSRPPPATLALMIATGVVSMAAMASSGGFGTGALTRQLLFNAEGVFFDWRVWTPFTYLFLEIAPINLLLYEVFGLWMFASPLERRWGARRFLYFFFGTGTGAALLTTLLAGWSSSLRSFPVFDGIYVASEAILVGWVLTNWSSTVYLLVFPVPAPFLLAVAVLIPLFNVIQGHWMPYVPVLLGMGIAYLMLRRGLSPRRAYLYFRAWWIDRQLKRKARHLRVIPPPDADRDRKGPDKYLH
jgi:membrane associated rhomboid family serine protease